MKSSGQATIPLAYAAEVSFEMALMRGECCTAAQALMNQRPLDEAALDECARLDDALAQAHRLLEKALKHIRLSRKQNNNLSE